MNESGRKPPPSEGNTTFMPDTAQPTDTMDEPRNGSIDELILQPLGESRVTTIRGPLSIYQSGFHWRTNVDAVHQTLTARRDDARAVKDGEIIARGIVYEVSPRPSDGTVTIYVEPPDFS